MKDIRIYNLKKGDVFTKKLQIKNREAFVVIGVNSEKNNLVVKSRNTGNSKTMASTNDLVIWLRNDPEA